MKIIKTIQELVEWRSQCEFPVDLVPTMGALHEGHLSLCEALQSKVLPNEKRYLVLSIYINPKQFNNSNDLDNYPVSMNDDIKLCEEQGVDVVFMPNNSDMYTADASVMISETQLSVNLCGAKRPGHFDGVCLVVSKLFNLVRPSRVAFGKKDFQQIAIIQKLIKDLSYPIELVAVETKRELDGLAMSSRNRRLLKEQRAKAPLIYATLQAAKNDNLSSTEELDIKTINHNLEQVFSPLEFKVDYLTIVHADTLQPCSSKNSQALLVLACFMGEIRLIDSIKLFDE